MQDILIATRSSPLALAQTRQVAALLERTAGVTTQLVPISGRRKPAELDKSRFVRAVDEAVVSGRADLAVHSAKDVPGDRPSELALAAVPPRADARDALCGTVSLAALPIGASVGTSSLRRRAQLMAMRPDLHVLELHGNVDSRLERLRRGDFDALVLAAAGLDRLGLRSDGLLSTQEMVPAPGQGALMLEARADDERTLELVAAVNDASAELALQAERTVAAELDAGCHSPLGAYAYESAGGLTLEVFVGAVDGSRSAVVTTTGERARALAKASVRALRRDHLQALQAAHLSPMRMAA